MSVPTHRAGCDTRLWPTTCPDCGKTVFFFSCTCGSRVFFDEPGFPWPRHGDRCVAYAFRSYIQSSGASPEEARDLIYDTAAQKGLEVEDSLIQMPISVLF